MIDGIPIYENVVRLFRLGANYDTHHGAFGRRVPPGFVVARKHAEMRATHELFVVESKDRV